MFDFNDYSGWPILLIVPILRVDISQSQTLTIRFSFVIFRGVSTNFNMRHLALTLTIAFVILANIGCGTIKGRTATEQLLVSDAVDQSIEQIDFTHLANEDVYLDCKYLKAVRGVGFVNAEYIISSLRQQMTVANCRLQESAAQAKFIVEVRVGCLGSDCHEVNYGIPGSQALNQTANLITNAPLPSVPEISLAKTDSCRAAAKISLFAYERESREPIWESGPSQGISLAKSTWILGAGPFQEGDIYDGVEEMQNKPINLPEVPPRPQESYFGQPILSFLKSTKQRMTGKQKTVQQIAQSNSELETDAKTDQIEEAKASEGALAETSPTPSKAVSSDSPQTVAVKLESESSADAPPAELKKASQPAESKVVQASASEPIESQK